MVYAELLTECMRDSPKFRSLLTDNESQIEQLELKLDKVLKMCGIMVDSGKTYVSQQSLFANSIWELSGCFRGDPLTTTYLTKIVHGLQEMNKYHTILLDQASRTILKSLTSFIKEDIHGVWESRHHFNKISSDLDVALTRHAQASKSKTIELEQAENLLRATEACFRHNVLDHVYCISMLQAKKKQEILGTLVSYLHACSTYFHQGSDLCEGLSPFLKDLSSEISKLREESNKLEKTLNNRHNLAASGGTVPETEPMQGYLFKRTSNAFRSWHRRWFCLRDHQLVYRKRTGDDEFTIMEEDLKLCSVKPVVDSERRFCFELMSPTRSHVLQADSEEAFQRWLKTLQDGIGAALQRGSSEVNHNRDGVEDLNQTSTPTAPNHEKLSRQIELVAGNDVCCDCSSTIPTWASINLGITLCIECSGIHRSLGVHHSKVRSLRLDSWEPEVLKVMLELGNCVVNRVYEATLPQDVTRPSATSNRAERETFIRRKWVNREFVAGLLVRKGSPTQRKWSVRRLRRRAAAASAAAAVASGGGESATPGGGVIVVGEEEEAPPLPPPSPHPVSDDDSTSGDEDANSTVSEEEMCQLNPTLLLYKASAAHNLPVMCRALALGANKTWTHPDHHNTGHLHQAVVSGSVMACEYLVLNTAPINLQDDHGKTPLHLAVELGHTAQVCLLLKHKADQHLADSEGRLPLDIAISMANADIVTLLRLGRLNEEMKESEAGGSDETFNDVVRDFSTMGPSALLKSSSSSPLLCPDSDTNE